jgi:hypothetical protein
VSSVDRQIWASTLKPSCPTVALLPLSHHGAMVSA